MIDNENVGIKVRHFINEVTNQLSSYNKLEFKILMHKFEVFIEQQYLIKKEQNTVQDFFTDVFGEINREGNSCTNIILLNSLIGIDLGNKIQKANLPKSIEGVLVPFIDAIQLFAQKKKEGISPTIAFTSLTMLYNHFPTYINSLVSDKTILAVFQAGLQEPSPEVLECGLEALKCALDNIDTCHFPINILCQNLMTCINSNKADSIEIACKAIELIIASDSNNINFLKFNSVPLNFFSSKEPAVKLAGYQILPLCYVCNPGLFTDDINVSILKAFTPQIRKKVQNRNEALLSLGNYLFARKGVVSKSETKRLDKCRKSVEELIDTDQAAYCYTAILTTNEELFGKHINVVFNVPLSSRLIEGLVNCKKILPTHSEFLDQRVLSIANTILLDGSSSPTSIINAFECLEKMGIPVESYSVELVLQYSLLMTNKNFSTRKAASRFVLWYQKKNPTIEVVQRVLAVISTESNNEHQQYLMKNLMKHPSDESILPFLQSLLHDLTAEIRLKALKYIAKLTHIKEASELLNDFLTEKVHDLEHSNVIYKEHIECFLYVSHAAFSDPKKIFAEHAKQLLVPFAQFLINYLLNSTQPLFTAAIQLLAQILPLSPQAVNIDKLANHINNCLLIHASQKKINAARNLLQSALDYTDLKFSIYGPQRDLIIRLFDLSSVQTNEESRVKFLKLLSSIGPLSPRIVSDLHTQTQTDSETPSLNTPNIYLTKYTPDEAIEALTMASVGVASLNLLDILLEDNLSSLHSIAIESFLNILRAHRFMITEELEAEILKRITFMITSNNASTISVLIKNMSTLITVLGERFTPLVPHAVDLICNNWTKLDQSLLTRISNWMMLYLPDAYIPHLPRIASLFVKYLTHSDIKYVTTILLAVYSFGLAVQTVDHILYPPLLSWISNHAKESIGDMLSTLKDILVNGGAQKFSSQVLRTMIHIVQMNPTLHDKALNIVFVVGIHLEQQFLLYIPHLTSVFNFYNNTNLKAYILCLEAGEKPPDYIINPFQPNLPSSHDRTKSSKNMSLNNDIPKIDFPKPQADFDESQWIKWCDELFSLLVRYSSSRAISACDTIIEKHSGIREALYPIAFALFYFQLKSVNNDSLDVILNQFFHCNGTPRNVVRHFLDVIEIIEVIGGQSLIKNEIITEKAQAADRIAQALRASEELFDICDNSQTEKLIVFNQQLGLPLAANGILRITKQRGFPTKAILSESLGLWDEALTLYSNDLEKSPKNEQLYKGKLNCLRALSKYSELKKASNGKNWILYKAAAEWRLFERDEFLSSTKQLNSNDTLDGLYYRSLYHTIKGEYDQAEKLINQMRIKYSDLIFPMISEDYERVYNNFSKVSYGTEIEEVIRYLKIKKQLENAVYEERINLEEELKRIIHTWQLRFSHLPNDPEIMHETLCIRSLALNITDLNNEFKKFLKCSIKQGKYDLANDTLNYLKNNNKNYENSIFQLMECRLLWALNKKEEAIEKIPLNNEMSHLIIGKWRMEMNQLNESYEQFKYIITNKNNITSDIWSLWSQVNLQLYEETKENSYLTESLCGLLNGLSLNQSDPLPFTLRILSILFRRGNIELYKKFNDNISSLPVSVWIDVLPQIIARSNSTDSNLRKLIQELISIIGLQQPHVVLYSLMVPIKDDTLSDRKRIATSIFNRLRIRYPTIVKQILTLANELIRTAVSWWEMWYSILDEASRAYITRKDNEEMINLLLPYHKLITNKPETFYEIIFERQFGQILSISESWIKKYKELNTDECLFQAWGNYINVFHKLKPIINDLTIISLKDASPLLYNLKDTQLVVPGTYKFNRPLINLTYVDPTMTVMKSKQRPRRMALIGSDGIKYTFLLKAHEDTRLDERVMQFFTLVNSFVLHSTMPLKNKLGITTYKVIPLTNEVGLIGWVPECNTLYDLVKSYREKHNVPLEIEYQSTYKMCPKFESLPFCNEKLNAFRKGLKVQKGNDLKHMIFALADDSNHWIERRTTYTTSLAMTSMAGYILGLGDRHMCNIMIKKRSAKLVHIDFGDCFEVAMHRDKFPEVVPFRLTRMLQNALEVSRIEGTFRSCCQNVMELLRKNGNTIIGLLEVFIYDPLRQWICENKEVEVNDNNNQESSSAILIMNRIKDKLNGGDFEPGVLLSVNDQVDKLIAQASSVRNLCMMFRGWFPWW
ncbi:PIKK family atypical protein kinase [Histomonas meleagridis]|uniref:PIKK family atypical protein kinase n=1 Tax=Histomonas meleagridis TaxID=135588 RepID=UPI00355A381D|nr:PIKK family atypical protein kinase [Histomonas meleagridis]KAH0799543.1 PIKK family atypical protein kinase [Histomonas meleagridis]